LSGGNVKTFLIVVISLVVVGAYAVSLRGLSAQTQASSQTAQKTESRFFCNRTALTAEQRRHQQELGKALRAALLGVQELTDGYEFEFGPEHANYQALAEFTPLEHACCPFFDVSIRMEREGGKLWWRLTGRDGVKKFIRAEFGPWFADRTL
jgi:hypothetical protein